MTRYFESPLLRGINQRLIHSGVAAVEQAVIVGAYHALNHAHEDDVVSWVYPEPGSSGTVPEECAFTIG